MRHAGPATLDRLDPLLAELRGIAGLSERSRGVFYRRSRAWLHFHDDPAGLFADLRRADGDFDRFAVDTPVQWRALLDRVCAADPR